MLAGAGVCIEGVSSLAEVVVPAHTLAGVTVPPGEAAVVAGHLLPGQAGQALAGTRVCQELLALTTCRMIERTITTTRTTMVLQLYTGAVGGAVHVHHDRVALQARSFGCASRPQTVKAET